MAQQYRHGHLRGHTLSSSPQVGLNDRVQPHKQFLKTMSDITNQLDLDNKLSSFDASEDLLSGLMNPDGAEVDQSLSTDLVSAAGLQDLNVVVNAEATISATSTAKSTANSANVSSDSASLASVEFNSGLKGSNVISADSNAGLSGTAGTTVKASALTSEGDAISYARIEDSAGISGVSSLTVGGELNALGKAVNTITSSSETVVGSAEAGSNLAKMQLGIEAAQVDVSSDATIQGLAQLTNSATASATEGELALAEAFANDLSGADLNGLKVGGVASVAGQTTFGNTSKATNVEGDATAESNLSFATGLDASEVQVDDAAAGIDVSSDATITGLSSVNSSASAETTAGVSVAESHGGNIKGLDIVDAQIGGIASITGQTSFTSGANSNSVTGDATSLGDISVAMGLEASSKVDVNSDATLKGITSLTGSATAATTAGDANAESYAGGITGADFGGLVDIGGIGQIQGAVNFNLSAKSTNITEGEILSDDLDAPANASTATAGDDALTAFGLKSFAEDAVAPGTAGTNIFDVKIASDATLSGTAIGSLKADAFSTATDATATLGGDSQLTGADLTELKVGGIASVTGAAQLTGNGTASSVDGTSQALSGLSADVTGLNASLMDVASDATLTAQAFGTLNATASSTGGDAVASAGQIDTTLTGISAGLELEIGGVGTVSALAQGSANAAATSVDGEATATAGMDVLGAEFLAFDSKSDGSLTGMAKLVATMDASNIGDIDHAASASGQFSAIGFDSLRVGNVEVNDDGAVTDGSEGIGGISMIKGQAQVTGTLNAESVSGAAFAGQNFDEGAGDDGAWVNDIKSMITGMSSVEMNGASDGTILGTASGMFNTTATSIQGDATGFSSQQLRGIDGLDLNLGGNGTINAIVNDTNFVTAHSVSGNATATASVDAIGLDGGSIHIAGNATIMANVGVDSKAEAVTVG